MGFDFAQPERTDGMLSFHPGPFALSEVEVQPLRKLRPSGRRK
jgi:hypothetical protein